MKLVVGSSDPTAFLNNYTHTSETKDRIHETMKGQKVSEEKKRFDTLSNHTGKLADAFIAAGGRDVPVVFLDPYNDVLLMTQVWYDEVNDCITIKSIGDDGHSKIRYYKDEIDALRR